MAESDPTTPPRSTRLLDRLLAAVRGDDDADTIAFVDFALSVGGIGVWTWSPEQGRVEWSDVQLALHGGEPFDGTTADHLARIHPDDRAEVSATLYDAQSRVGDVTYRVGDDRVARWLEARWDRRDSGPSRIGVTIDVTDARRREARAEREARILAGLHDASSSLMRTSGVRPMLHSVARSTAELLGCRGALVLIDPAEEGAEAEWIDAGTRITPEAPPTTALATAVDLFERTQYRVEHDLGSDVVGTVGRLLGVGAAPRAGSAVTAALRRAGAVVGVIIFIDDEPGAFDAEDLRLVAGVAAQTSVALPAAARYERQRSAVLALQQRLLPSRALDFVDFEVCARYRPALIGFAVGGDWYDLIEPAPGSLVAVVGDARGHGMEAAAHMAELRFSFRALLRAGIPVGDALRQLNQLCVAELDTSATVVVVALEPDGRVQVWSAGHVPVLLRRPDGRHRWMDDDAHRVPVLGWLDDVAPSALVDRLEDEEVLVLYTDGLIERREESLDEGLARLAREAAAPIGPRLDAWADVMLSNLGEGVDLADDTALVAIRRRRR